MAKIPNPYIFTTGPSNGEWVTKSRFFKFAGITKQQLQELMRDGGLHLHIDDSGVKRFWSTDAHNCLLAYIGHKAPPPLEKDPTAQIHSFFSREE